MSAKRHARKRRCGARYRPCDPPGPRSEGRSNRRRLGRSARRKRNGRESGSMLNGVTNPESGPPSLTCGSTPSLIPLCRTRRLNPAKRLVGLPGCGRPAREESICSITTTGERAAKVAPLFGQPSGRAPDGAIAAVWTYEPISCLITPMSNEAAICPTSSPGRDTATVTLPL